MPEMRGASMVPSLPLKTKTATTPIPNNKPKRMPMIRSSQRWGRFAAGPGPGGPIFLGRYWAGSPASFCPSAEPGTWT